MCTRHFKEAADRNVGIVSAKEFRAELKPNVAR